MSIGRDACGTGWSGSWTGEYCDSCGAVCSLTCSSAAVDYYADFAAVGDSIEGDADRVHKRAGRCYEDSSVRTDWL